MTPDPTAPDPTAPESAGWYVVRRTAGNCDIVAAQELAAQESTTTDDENRWGPFASQGEAIARRVGLIRAGKCRPV
ncbi:MAG: hypothetical protein ACFB8W_01095 [Elainellaceae cyanobacterium]